MIGFYYQTALEGLHRPTSKTNGGYLQMADEAMNQSKSKASHVFLQAGVGGLAGAVAAHIRKFGAILH